MSELLDEGIAWRELAMCKDAFVEGVNFFPEVRGNRQIHYEQAFKEAKETITQWCDRCPVADECLREGLVETRRNEDYFAIYGGQVLASGKVINIDTYKRGRPKRVA